MCFSTHWRHKYSTVLTGRCPPSCSPKVFSIQFRNIHCVRVAICIVLQQAWFTAWQMDANRATPTVSCVLHSRRVWCSATTRSHSRPRGRTQTSQTRHTNTQTRAHTHVVEILKACGCRLGRERERNAIFLQYVQQYPRVNISVRSTLKVQKTKEQP